MGSDSCSCSSALKEIKSTSKNNSEVQGEGNRRRCSACELPRAGCVAPSPWGEGRGEGNAPSFPSENAKMQIKGRRLCDVDSSRPVLTLLQRSACISAHELVVVSP